MISQTAEYALRAVICLARHRGTPIPVHRIAQSTRVPEGYLSKVLQALSKAGLVDAQRGLHGGFVLRGSGGKISLLDVVLAVDPVWRVQSCPLGMKDHRKDLCPLHLHLDAAARAVEKSLRAVTVKQIVQEEARRKLACGERA